MFNFSGEKLSLQFRSYMTFGILTVNIDGLRLPSLINNPVLNTKGLFGPVQH